MSVGNGEAGGSAASAEERPLGTIVASAIEGLRLLGRKHVELAKIEATEAVSIRGRGVGLIATAAVVAMYAIGFVAAAAAAALTLVMPTWAAILIVGTALVVIAGVLVLVARRMLRSAPPPGERTRATLKEDARWAKQQIAR